MLYQGSLRLGINPNITWRPALSRRGNTGAMDLGKRGGGTGLEGGKKGKTEVQMGCMREELKNIYLKWLRYIEAKVLKCQKVQTLILGGNL